ncbi:MAG: hypothetical protein D6796_06785 [Caldilineae bacterium]|nr:MAG: hypothetical protein D6796_06785 [Caldilineae bacterium]
MFPILLQTLALASSGLLSVGSMTLVILLLLSERGWRNGLGYALGYASAYSLIGTGVVGMGYRAAQSGDGHSSPVFSLVLLALGGLLLWLGFRNSRKPPVENPEPPRFFAIVDGITPLQAFGFGALVTVLNFKNLALYLTALSVVILSGLPLAQKLTVATLAALVFSLSVLIPTGIYLLAPRRARQVLDAFKNWLGRHSRAIGIWAPLGFGLLFVLKGVSDLLL